MLELELGDASQSPNYAKNNLLDDARFRPDWL
jgi:hypothetical protein